MAKFKQTQIHPGVTKTRSSAVKVYLEEAVTEGDILIQNGVEGDFLKVRLADSNVAAKRLGVMFVADYSAAAGEYTPVAVPWKIVSAAAPTSGAIAVNDPVYLNDGATTGETTDETAGTGSTIIVGRFVESRDSGTANCKAILWPGKST
tara:strand:+ start:1759 stop:2205 length:447 start_codon:yes stop_codon:yes gene_type:complete